MNNKNQTGLKFFKPKLTYLIRHDKCVTSKKKRHENNRTSQMYKPSKSILKYNDDDLFSNI